jgi:predicted metalloprotease
MRWTPGRRSQNLEDRRAESGRRRRPFPFPLGRGGAGGARVPRGRAPRLGVGGLLVLIVVFFLLPDDLKQLLLSAGSQLDAPGGQVNVPMGGSTLPRPDTAPASPEEEHLVDFVSFVLDDLQETWTKLLPGYREAKLVLYRGSIRSGCGSGAAEMGPFYCPVDEKVYVDLSFYEELRARFGAPGDFAQAYVLAHEVGHHVQKVAGIESQVRSAQRRDPDASNELSVRMELQADCLAGVWANHTARRGTLEAGDVEEGLRAAGAIGDDRLQKMQTGYVQPDAFTHGSSDQRTRWLQRGIESGDPDRCDAFEVARP